MQIPARLGEQRRNVTTGTARLASKERFPALVEDLVEDFRAAMLTVREVAARLKVSPSGVRSLCRRGFLRHTLVLNFIRIRPEDVERFLASRGLR